eukprot:CAMPEP_0204532912 /NCGR_PEP_ID=MMETSP0661-20131031/11991_1 /ASSEMBLY_ACC=CAM_ASM_000606 /TAXON_ID=109239 /ORGANISM="Alexandrium margalefi, Strain AMGDE01CS-322" /LENGTH=93 /DNA_ID=CAMNT_0051539201 /DNA_START=51 /DNA_END=332 /DNA_ORIENTATION=-
MGSTGGLGRVLGGAASGGGTKGSRKVVLAQEALAILVVGAAPRLPDPAGRAAHAALATLALAEAVASEAGAHGAPDAGGRAPTRTDALTPHCS